jgi:hypothetical protein
MSAPEGRVPLPGSERAPVADARRVGDVDPQRLIQVTVVVRPRGGDERARALEAIAGSEAPAAPLSHDEFAERLGAKPADLERVAEFARAHGLEVVESDPGRRARVRGRGGRGCTTSRRRATAPARRPRSSSSAAAIARRTWTPTSPAAGSRRGRRCRPCRSTAGATLRATTPTPR